MEAHGFGHLQHRSDVIVICGPTITQVADFVKEALRVAPVAYLMAPWLYCSGWTQITNVWWREFPGVNVPVLLSRYERPAQLLLEIA